MSSVCFHSVISFQDQSSIYKISVFNIDIVQINCQKNIRFALISKKSVKLILVKVFVHAVAF